MRPSQVLDKHADLWSRLEGREYLEITYETFLREAVAMFPDHQREAKGAAESFLQGMHVAVQLAECYRVTEDMVDLLRHAASVLEEEDTFDRDLAPTAAGLVHFEKPLRVGAFADGRDLNASWLLWGPMPVLADGRPRMASYWFDDAREAVMPEDEEVPESWSRITGGWDLIGWDSTPQGRSMGPMIVSGAVADANGRPVVLPVSDRWKYAEEQDNDIRLLHALWLLLGQTITVLREEPIDRSARKRAVKKGLPPRVTTIALRRAEHRPAEGETHVEWQHRWIVRGHWRWQPCGPGRSERKRIWIGPFVKGPEDAPLKQSEKLYSLQR